MNATKWRELALRMEAIQRGELLTRVKYLLDESPSGFTCLDWDWVKSGDASIIEWLEIDPVFRTHRGRLIADRTEDLTDRVAAALREVGVPFSAEKNVLKVWGHVRPGKQPTFA